MYKLTGRSITNYFGGLQTAWKHDRCHIDEATRILQGVMS
jgi:hypothetical protein